MNIEIKKSKKPIKYEYAIDFMETRLQDIHENNSTQNEKSSLHEFHEEANSCMICTSGTLYKIRIENFKEFIFTKNGQ